MSEVSVTSRFSHIHKDTKCNEDSLNKALCVTVSFIMTMSDSIVQSYRNHAASSNHDIRVCMCMCVCAHTHIPCVQWMQCAM